MDHQVKIIAFYLPQFHPIPENDKWWGEGFTEWTNVKKAKPLFKGHYQPRIPSDLGYYDLRNSEIREEQARMARANGIYGFCYWHYWFGNGKQLLEKPFNEVLTSGKPEFPLCLGWANESWMAKSWNPSETKKDKLLIEQKYLGEKDNEQHFYSLLNAFKDKRYITINNRPFFLIYKPEQFKNITSFINQWNELARKNGFENGFYFVAQASSFDKYHKLKDLGFDAITIGPMTRLIGDIIKSRSFYSKVIDKISLHFLRIKKLKIIEYKKAIKYFVKKEEDSLVDVIPSIMPNWDHSPRSNQYAWVLHNSTPELFSKHVIEVIDTIKNKPSENKIIFLKSWNEWAEGNYMEPDIKFGRQYLEALKETIEKYS